MAEHSASHRETLFTWQRRSPAIQRTVHKEVRFIRSTCAIFLTVQDNSISEIVTLSVDEWVTF